MLSPIISASISFGHTDSSEDLVPSVNTPDFHVSSVHLDKLRLTDVSKSVTSSEVTR
jgi:hypothetical protein